MIPGSLPPGKILLVGEADAEEEKKDKEEGAGDQRVQ